MMAIPRGLVLALDLARAPVLAEAMRRQPLLPSSDMLVLLRIAGGCPDASRKAVEATGESLEHIEMAVVLYLKQVLLFPDADSYRVLGVEPHTPQETVREHLHWIMRWLHPDRNRNSWESVFATRVLSAWEDLKSPRKRENYDRSRNIPVVPPSHRMSSQKNMRRAGIPWIAAPVAQRSQPGRVWFRLLVLSFVVCLAVWFTWPHKLLLGFFAEEAGANSDPMAAPAGPGTSASERGENQSHGSDN